jgi:MFS superfamily sulfate permease-like transporter
MKSNDSRLRDHAKCVQQKGTITLVAMVLVLATILTITGIPRLFVIIPSSLKAIIIAFLAAQVTFHSFAGRHEDH